MGPAGRRAASGWLLASSLLLCLAFLAGLGAAQAPFNSSALTPSNSSVPFACEYGGVVAPGNKCSCSRYFDGARCEITPIMVKGIVPFVAVYTCTLFTLTIVGIFLSISGFLYNSSVSRQNNTPLWTTATFVLFTCVLSDFAALLNAAINITVVTSVYENNSRLLHALLNIAMEIAMSFIRIGFTAFELLWISLAGDLGVFQKPTVTRLKRLVIAAEVLFSVIDGVSISIKEGASSYTLVNLGSTAWNVNGVIALIVGWVFSCSLAFVMRRWGEKRLPPASVARLKSMTQYFLISYSLLFPGMFIVLFFVVVKDAVSSPIRSMMQWSILGSFGCSSTLVKIVAVHQGRSVGWRNVHCRAFSSARVGVSQVTQYSSKNSASSSSYDIRLVEPENTGS